MRRRGLALLLTVGVLGILGVLGAAFVTLARLERRASLQRVLSVQAGLLARSGTEDALARVTAGQFPSYGGEDWDGDGALSGFEGQQEIFQSGILNAADCPARCAMRPSFFVDDGAGTPKYVAAEGRLRGVSGVLAAGAYSVKVEDESAKVNANGGFLDALNRDGDLYPDHCDADVRPFPADPKDTGLGWNFQLCRILNLLGARPEVGVANLGNRVLRFRPPGGYVSVQDLQKRISCSTDLSPWITVSSWSDRSVVHPNGYDAQLQPSAPSDLKKGRRPLLLEEGGRPPVNLNAASRPVLAVLLEGLKARSWHEGPMMCLIPPGMAQAAADALCLARPYRDWEAFGQACDALVPSVLSGFNAGAQGGGNLCAADLLKANFNPNTQLSKEFPDQLMWKWIDKSDFSVWSTEGCLSATGTFRIEAAARIVRPDGSVLAERTSAVLVEAFTLLRQTSQKDFVAGRALPTEYLSLSDPSPPTPIPAQRTAGAGASWNPTGGGRGLGMVTYPCGPTALPARAAEFDGFLALATTETDPAFPGLRFLHHFDDGWDADVGAPSARVPAPGVPAMDGKLQTDPAMGTWPPPPTEPGILYPDGMHAQIERLPAFAAQGNLPATSGSGDPPSNHGAIGYWVKPSGLPQRMDLYCIRTGGGGTQALGIGRYGSQWGLLVENATSGVDTGIERQFHVFYDSPGDPVVQPGMRWMRVSAFLDTDQTVLGQDVRLDLRCLRGGGVQDGINGYALGFAIQPPEDIAQPGVAFVLGGDVDLGIENQLSGANQVVDEFEICDFGDTAVPALALFQVWGEERYRDGRYYKGGDARFLSAPLPGSGRLLRAEWTEWRPAAVRMEMPNGPALPPAGQPRSIDPVLKDDPVTGPRAWVELELLDAAGTLSGVALQPLVQGAPMNRMLPGFRYRARLRTDLADPLNEPLLETPVLDDVTFAVQAAAGPRVLAWR